MPVRHPIISLPLLDPARVLSLARGFRDESTSKQRTHRVAVRRAIY